MVVWSCSEDKIFKCKKYVTDGKYIGSQYNNRCEININFKKMEIDTYRRLDSKYNGIFNMESRVPGK